MFTVAGVHAVFVGSCLAFTGFVVSYFKLQDPSEFMPQAPKAAPGGGVIRLRSSGDSKRG